MNLLKAIAGDLADLAKHDGYVFLLWFGLTLCVIALPYLLLTY